VVVRSSIEEHVRIRRMHKQGLPERQIARTLGRSWSGVRFALRPSRTRERLWDPSPARLSMAEREARAVSTISREVANNGGRERYRAVRAHRQAARHARRPKPAKLTTLPGPAGRIELSMSRTGTL
jgi:IS30 family transposase